MRFIYSDWNEDLLAKLKNLTDLMAIFNYLLMRMNGNVEETLRMMEKLQQKGYLDAK